jgi:TatD DNase family protein
MEHPEPGDYIDIHNHGSKPCRGHFQVENLMAHEKRNPDNETGLTYTIGIHPWFLTTETFEYQIEMVNQFANHQNIIAIGEAGFDRLKGPDPLLQRIAFEEQVKIADKVSKPLFIHCVRAWDELLSEHKRLRPVTPWIIHGFRGKRELARQLISKKMYLSFWFDFVLKPDSTSLLQSLPKDIFFLETDGSGIKIETLYKKVADDLNLDKKTIKSMFYSNFKKLFK